MKTKILFFLFSGLITASFVNASMVEIPSSSAKPSKDMERGIDRTGSDYRKFPIKTGSPFTCRSACYNEKRCKAWTFVKKNIQGPTAMCYLKDSVPNGQKNNCCTSGVASVVKKELEYGMDRTGGDYKKFATGDNPLSCLKACSKDGKCKSFTYVKQGFQGKKAQCYLKDSVPKKKRAKCCISAAFPHKK